MGQICLLSSSIFESFSKTGKSEIVYPEVNIYITSVVIISLS